MRRTILMLLVLLTAAAQSAAAGDPRMLFDPAAVEARYGRAEMEELRGLYQPGGPGGLALSRPLQASELSSSSQARVYRRWIEQVLPAARLRAAEEMKMKELRGLSGRRDVERLRALLQRTFTLPGGGTGP